MFHEVRAVVKVELHVYVDDEKCEKDDAQIVREGKQAILDGEGDMVEDFEVEEQDILGIWFDHSVPD